MLKGIDPRLNTLVLCVLRPTDQLDTAILVDQNFPADSDAKATSLGQLFRMENLTNAEAARALPTVLPLDTLVDDDAGRMAVVGRPDAIQPVQVEVHAEIDHAKGRPRPVIGIEHFAFYDPAREACVVIRTSERRFYGCFMLRKGVVPPDA